MSLFLQIFLAVAAGLLALVVLAFVLKLLLVAALIAGVAFAAIVLFGIIRRSLTGRTSYPIRRL